MSLKLTSLGELGREISRQASLISRQTHPRSTSLPKPPTLLKLPPLALSRRVLVLPHAARQMRRRSTQGLHKTGSLAPRSPLLVLHRSVVYVTVVLEVRGARAR